MPVSQYSNYEELFEKESRENKIAQLCLRKGSKNNALAEREACSLKEKKMHEYVRWENAITHYI